MVITALAAEILEVPPPPSAWGDDSDRPDDEPPAGNVPIPPKAPDSPQTPKNGKALADKDLQSSSGMQVAYYGYRYYDSVTGRWPSRDPIGEWGGVNLYAFLRNSPLSSVDLLGNQSLTLDENGEIVWDTDGDGMCDDCDRNKIAKGKESLIKTARDRVQFMKERADKNPDYIGPAGSEGTKFEESCGELNIGYYREMKVPDCWVCYMEHRADYDANRPIEERFHDHWWITCVAFTDDGGLADELIIDFWRKGVNQGESPKSNRERWPYPATSESERGSVGDRPHKDSSGKSPNFPATDLEGIPTKEEQNRIGLPPNLTDQGRIPNPDVE